MADLILHVKGEYFDQMKSGEKLHEYRLCTTYWKKRIERYYDRIIICRGYPKRDDMERRLIRPWRGASIQTITHKHFGDKPVAVYAINVNVGLSA